MSSITAASHHSLRNAVRVSISRTEEVFYPRLYSLVEASAIIRRQFLAPEAAEATENSESLLLGSLLLL